MSGAISTQLKSLRTLVKVREREGKRLEETLAEARKLLSQRIADRDAAVADHAQAMQAETAARQEREALYSGSFTPAGLRAIDYQIDEHKANVKKFEKAIADRTKHVDFQNGVVAQAQAAVRRNQQRIESFEERIKKLIKEREAASEEAAEEEAEEAGVARFIARTRAAREEVSCE